LITASSPHGTYTFDGNTFGTVQITGAGEQDALTVESGANTTFTCDSCGRHRHRHRQPSDPRGRHQRPRRQRLQRRP
jgi:hypothetical protein